MTSASAAARPRSVPAAPPMAAEGLATSTAAALYRLTEAAATTAAVRAASSLGVFQLFADEEGWLDAPGVADRLGLSVRGTGHLLDALYALGLLEQSGARYRAIAARATVTATGESMWSALEDAVRTGTGDLHVHRADAAADFYSEAVAFLSVMVDPTAELVARRISPVPGQRRVLEVGAGAAPWSRAIARLDPMTRVTALDLAPVLKVTRRHVADDGLSAQYSYAPGDALTVELRPAAYDLVLVPNVCRLFDAATNLILLSRLARALAPGGRLVVIDAVPGESPELRRGLSLYALGLMMRTDVGGVHPESEYRRWFADAGLVDLARWDVWPDHPLAVISGRRAE